MIHPRKLLIMTRAIRRCVLCSSFLMCSFALLATCAHARQMPAQQIRLAKIDVVGLRQMKTEQFIEASLLPAIAHRAPWQHVVHPLPIGRCATRNTAPDYNSCPCRACPRDDCFVFPLELSLPGDGRRGCGDVRGRRGAGSESAGRLRQLRLVQPRRSLDGGAPRTANV